MVEEQVLWQGLTREYQNIIVIALWKLLAIAGILLHEFQFHLGYFSDGFYKFTDIQILYFSIPLFWKSIPNIEEVDTAFTCKWFIQIWNKPIYENDLCQSWTGLVEPD